MSNYIDKVKFTYDSPDAIAYLEVDGQRLFDIHVECVINNNPIYSFYIEKPGVLIFWCPLWIRYEHMYRAGCSHGTAEVTVIETE